MNKQEEYWNSCIFIYLRRKPREEKLLFILFLFIPPVPHIRNADFKAPVLLLGLSAAYAAPLMLLSGKWSNIIIRFKLQKFQAGLPFSSSSNSITTATSVCLVHRPPTIHWPNYKVLLFKKGHL